jgi:Ice-binding-like/IPTL-CTERM motif
MTRRYAIVTAVVGLAALVGSTTQALAQTAPSLGTAQTYAVLGGSTVTNTGSSVITGDLGVSPGSAVIGFPPGLVSAGTIHAADAAALQAQNDVITAYNNLTGQACTADLTGQDLGGLTLTPGVYCFSTSAQLTGTLTLNAQGNPAAVFIFKMGSTITTASNSRVVLSNGGQTCNVFWQVGTSATLGTGTAFAGNILALASITLTTGAQVIGKTLARNGAVTLDTNAVNGSPCNPAACPAIILTPAALPNGTVGVAYNQTIVGSGGLAPYVFTVATGAPPAGIGVSTAGVVAGTPTSAAAPTFTVRGTDANGCFAIVTYTLTILPAVPTLPEWAMMALTLLLALAGVAAMRNRRSI